MECVNSQRYVLTFETFKLAKHVAQKQPLNYCEIIVANHIYQNLFI